MEGFRDYFAVIDHRELGPQFVAVGQEGRFNKSTREQSRLAPLTIRRIILNKRSSDAESNPYRNRAGPSLHQGRGTADHSRPAANNCQ